MKIFKLLMPAMVLAGTFGVCSLAPVMAADAPADGWHGHRCHGDPWRAHRWHGGDRAAVAHLLRRLDLTAEQRTRIKAILAKGRADAEAQFAKRRATRESMAGLSPKDPAFVQLLQTAKADAAAGVQRRADLWAEIYGALTPSQQGRIPGILAADKKAREDREAEWQAHHDDAPGGQ